MKLAKLLRLTSEQDERERKARIDAAIEMIIKAQELQDEAERCWHDGKR